MVKKKKRGKVRPLALCVFRRGDHILVTEYFDDLKQAYFYRPLGGRIEFGEYSQQTVARELLEEIGEAVTELRFRGMLENIFTYNGEKGHEIVLLYEGKFENPAMYAQDMIEGREGAARFTVRWMPLGFFRRGGAPLYPDGLLELLLESDSPL